MQDEQKGLEAKESTESSLEYRPSDNQDSQPPVSPPQAATPPKGKKIDEVRRRLSAHWSIYVPVFLILVIILILGAILLYHNQNGNKVSLKEQNLSASQLNSLASTNDTIGSSNQVLTVQSSAIFSSQVLIRGQLQVAGQLQLSQLAVSKDLSIAGNASIQGSLTIQNGINVSGNGTFSGALSTPQLTTAALQLNGNLTLSHHLLISGSIPSRTTGSATGNGGTTSVNGSDTAGTLTINTGSSPFAGCYETVTFTTPFSGTPHMLLTPIGASSATLTYYVNRTSTAFSICSDNAPQAGQTYVFDYFVID